MKKMKWAMMLAALLSLGVYANGESVVVGYSSQGPDRYADGSTVRDGECYALVCTKSGTSFGGFNMDGTLANPQNDDLAAIAPAAKDGRCQSVLFVLPKEYRTKHKDDTWCVYLVDTRCATGRPVGLKDGLLARVNCFSRPDAKISFSDGLASLQSVLAPTGGLCAEMLAEQGQTPNPVITAVAVKDGKLEVQVANTVDWVTYDLAGGQKPDAAKEPMADQPQDGDATRPIVLTTTADEKAKFVRVVNRAGMFRQPKENAK